LPLEADFFEPDFLDEVLLALLFLEEVLLASLFLDDVLLLLVFSTSELLAAFRPLDGSTFLSFD